MKLSCKLGDSGCSIHILQKHVTVCTAIKPAGICCSSISLDLHAYASMDLSRFTCIHEIPKLPSG